MKKLSTYLFLLLFSFSAPSFADDIRDFKIEGMSIGDSLLDYFTKEYIKNKLRESVYPNQNEIHHVFLLNEPTFNIYEGIQVHVRTNDEKFIIIGIDGFIYFADNFKGCKKKMKEIALELNNTFNFNEETSSKGTHPGDKTGKSKWSRISFFLKTSGPYAEIEIICYDNSKEFVYVDKLSITFYGEEYKKFLNNYYK